jgi:superoxide dismutase
MKPGGSKPEGELLKKMVVSFGSVENLKKQLQEAAVTQLNWEFAAANLPKV